MTERVDSEPDSHHLRGPGELIQAVPYLLGFHPRDSLVLVGLREGLVAVAARLDLADASSDLLRAATARPADPACTGIVAGTLHSMRRGGTERVIAVVYCDDLAPADTADDLPWTPLVIALAGSVGESECVLLDALLVRHGRFWSYPCDSSGGCPTEGSAVPDCPSAFAAAATVEGTVPMPDRASLEQSLTPHADDERARLLPLLEAVSPAPRPTPPRSLRRALMAAARASAEARWNPPDDETAAAFAAALREAGTRDALWLAVDDRRIDGRRLWRELARRVPAPWDVTPLFLYGWASWRAGDGAQANMAATRALAVDPTYAAADMLLAALSQGVDPRTFPTLRRSA